MAHESLERTELVVGGSNRAFGIVFSVVFAIVAVFPLFFGGALRAWSAVVALVFLTVAFVAPRTLTPLNRLWTRFGLFLHTVVSPIALGIMFFGVITPLGLLMRLLGKNPLALRTDASAPSYWIDRKPPGPKPESLKDQF